MTRVVQRGFFSPVNHYRLAFFLKISYNRNKEVDIIPLVWLTRKIRKLVSDAGPDVGGQRKNPKAMHDFGRDGWRTTEKSVIKGGEQHQGVAVSF